MNLHKFGLCSKSLTKYQNVLWGFSFWCYVLLNSSFFHYETPQLSHILEKWGQYFSGKLLRCIYQNHYVWLSKLQWRQFYCFFFELLTIHQHSGKGHQDERIQNSCFLWRNSSHWIVFWTTHTRIKQRFVFRRRVT